MGKGRGRAYGVIFVITGFAGSSCGYALPLVNADGRDVLPEMVVGLQGLVIGGGKGICRPTDVEQTLNGNCLGQLSERFLMEN